MHPARSRISRWCRQRPRVDRRAGRSKKRSACKHAPCPLSLLCSFHPFACYPHSCQVLSLGDWWGPRSACWLVFCWLVLPGFHRTASALLLGLGFCSQVCRQSCIALALGGFGVSLKHVFVVQLTYEMNINTYYTGADPKQYGQKYMG